MVPPAETAEPSTVPARLPTVLTAPELLDKAFRRSGKVGEMHGTREEKAKQRELARVHAVGNTLTAALRKYEVSFPSFERLPDFHRELLRLTIDVDRARQALGSVKWARERVESLQNEQTRRLKRAPLPELGRIRLHAHGRMASVVKQIAKNLAYLTEVRKALRGLPTLSPGNKTIVVAGYPNVGKSSLVRKISSAEPEIAPYPFTTKGVIVGHFTHRRVRYQIVDTPGLLDRPLEERNAIELQAVLALRHLADVVVFLLDPSEHCGYPLERQLHLLQEIRNSFDVPILEVEWKVDVKRTGSARLKASGESGEGVEAVVKEFVRLAGEPEGMPVRRGTAAADKKSVREPTIGPPSGSS